MVSFPRGPILNPSSISHLFPMRPRGGTSSPSPSPSPSPPLSFSSPESLSAWLRPRLPSTTFALWGVQPGTKTVHNLFSELSLGETSLTPSPPLLRTVHVATVLVHNSSGMSLLESHQLLSDGTLRTRLRPLSEKMRPGETVEAAAVRAVREELGVVGVRIVEGSYRVRVEERGSASYPGLPARYVLHSVEAKVEGLPEDGEFSTEEVGEGCLDGERNGEMVLVKRHFWKWVSEDDEKTGRDC